MGGGERRREGIEMTPSNQTRRTVLKTIGAGVVSGTILSGTASAHDDGFGYPGEQPEVADMPPVFPTWGSDGTDHHEMLDPAQPQKSNENSHRPFYHIAPSGGDHSPHLFGILDNVVDTPSSGGGKYSAMWHVHFVLDTTEEPLPNSPFPYGLASFSKPTVSKVQDTIETKSNILEIDSGAEFVCPVRPHRGPRD